MRKQHASLLMVPGKAVVAVNVCELKKGNRETEKTNGIFCTPLVWTSGIIRQLRTSHCERQQHATAASSLPNQRKEELHEPVSPSWLSTESLHPSFSFWIWNRQYLNFLSCWNFGLVTSWGRQEKDYLFIQAGAAAVDSIEKLDQHAWTY